MAVFEGALKLSQNFITILLKPNQMQTNKKAFLYIERVQL